MNLFTIKKLGLALLMAAAVSIAWEGCDGSSSSDTAAGCSKCYTEFESGNNACGRNNNSCFDKVMSDYKDCMRAHCPNGGNF